MLRNLLERAWIAPIVATLAASAAASRRGAVVLYVDDNGPAGDGLSWATSMRDIQAALSAAGSSFTITEIRVAQGTYVPSVPAVVTFPRSKVFDMVNGVSLVGGYAGVGAPNPDMRDPALYPTRLSADLNGDDAITGIITDNAYRVIDASFLSSSTRLDGFILTGGNADGSSTLAGSGAALTATISSALIVNCVMSQNRAHLTGGAAYIFGGSPVFQNCRFESNIATDAGGGVYARDASPSFIDCTIFTNIANGNGGAASYGAGLVNASFNGCNFSENNPGKIPSTLFMGAGTLHCQSCLFADHGPGNAPLVEMVGSAGGTTATIDDCTFHDNHRTAVSIITGPLTVTKSTFTRNGGTQFGAAIAKRNGADLIVSGSTFDENATTNWGGAIFGADRSMTIDRCTFTGNTGGLGGGVFAMSDIDLHIGDCQFTNNTATVNGEGGGAIRAGVDGVDIVDCTFDSNSTAGGGGALWALASSGSIRQCEFNSNTAEIGGGAWISGPSSGTLPPSLVSVSDCSFHHNHANGTGGGAIFHKCLVGDCAFTGNDSDGDAGGASCSVSGSCPKA